MFFIFMSYALLLIKPDSKFKALNQISNRNGAPLFPKNALRKGEKKNYTQKKVWKIQ